MKQAFIAKCLAKYNEEVIEAIRAAAKRQGVGVTDEAVNSLSYQIYQQSAGARSDLSFREYLRFIDMGAGRGHPLGGLKKTKLALQSSNKVGIAQVKDKTRKPKKIYSKIAYGKLGFLQGELLYGYTEEAIAAIKNEMQNKP
jgi:hypothetical protein